MPRIKILLLEDDPEDAFLINDCLTSSGLSFETEVVDTRQQYENALQERSFDVILADHRLQMFNSLDALKIRNEKHIDTPFILITGQISEESAIMVMKEGASDFILKDRMQRLPYAVKLAIDRIRHQSFRQEAEISLRKTNERFENAAKASFDVIFDFDIEKNKLFCSEAFTELYGYPSGEDLTAAAITRHIHPEDYKEAKNTFIDFIKRKKTRWSKLFRYVKKDGTIAMVKTAAILLYKNSIPYRVVGVMHDSTELMQLQNQLLETELQKQKDFAETAIKAQEKERKEIGKELHDNVNQLLATAKLLIQTARSNPETKEDLLDKTNEIIISAIQEVRNISHSIMPPSFDEVSFTMAIKDIAAKINLAGRIEMEVVLPGTERLSNLSDQMKLAIYRIIQEQVTNILKYSRAEKALIELKLVDHLATLSISDNGKGFDPKRKKGGIGFSNITNRARLLNGSMEIKAAPGSGCTVSVVFPLPK
jgi:two-component system sensor histidine kinase UhpB